MAEEDTGALGQVADTPPPGRPGGIGALQTIAYGDGGQNPLAAAPSLLDKTLSPEHLASQKEQAYWGGLTDPKDNPGQSLGVGLGNALRARNSMSIEQDKLKAAYMPLIMQSIVQSQQMTLAAAQASRQMQAEAFKNFGPWMAGLRNHGNVPTKQEAVEHLKKFADMFPMAPGQLAGFAASIPEKPQDVAKYLDSMILSAKPEAAISQPGTNAAGQPVSTNAALNTISPLTPSGGAGAGGGGGAGSPGDLGVNPSKVAVGATEKGLEGYNKVAEEHSVVAQTLHDMVARMTEVRDLQQQVQSGKYAKPLSDLAAHMKDIATRLGMPEDKANELANKIAGGQGGGPNAVAAAQAIGAIGLMESMAQLRTSVGPGNRINMPEFREFQDKIKALSQDPDAFAKIYDFSRQQYGNHVNKYHMISQSMQDAGIKQSPYIGDAKYHVNEAQRLLGDNAQNSVGAGPVPEPTPTSTLGAAGRRGDAGVQATGQPSASGTQTAAGNGPASKRAIPPPLKDPRELTLYEKGAILSPRGIPIIQRNGTWVYAKKAQ